MIVGATEYMDVVFADGEHQIFCITDLKEWVARVGVKPNKVTVTPELASQVRQNGIEPEHLARLRAKDPDFSPAIMIEKNGAMYVIDGNHRACMWIGAGSRVIPALILKEMTWRLFQKINNPAPRIMRTHTETNAEPVSQ